MKLKDFKYAYNKLKHKLLLETFITANLPKLSSVDKEAYFLDFTFYNSLLSYRKNKNIKLRAAKKIYFTKQIRCGAIINNFHYERERFEGKTVLEYYPYQLVRKREIHIYKYNFTDSPKTFEQTVKWGRYKQYKNQSVRYYTNIESVFGSIYVKKPKFFENYVHHVEYTQNQIIKVVFVNTFKRFDIFKTLLKSTPHDLHISMKKGEAYIEWHTP